MLYLTKVGCRLSEDTLTAELAVKRTTVSWAGCTKFRLKTQGHEKRAAEVGTQWQVDLLSFALSTLGTKL